jgi:hypothetical protein
LTALLSRPASAVSHCLLTDSTTSHLAQRLVPELRQSQMYILGLTPDASPVTEEGDHLAIRRNKRRAFLRPSETESLARLFGRPKGGMF